VTTFLADPASIDGLGVEALAQLLEECAAQRECIELLERRVRARLCRELTHRVHGEDRLLDIDEATARLHVTVDWLRRRPHLPFVRKLSDGIVRYSAQELDRFIAASRPNANEVACQKCSPMVHLTAWTGGRRAR
jgi:hypothetical protein